MANRLQNARPRGSSRNLSASFTHGEGTLLRAARPADARAAVLDAVGFGGHDLSLVLTRE